MTNRPGQPADNWRSTKVEADPALAPWRGGPFLPLIGITADIVHAAGATTPRPRAAVPMTYVRAVSEAGGIPVLLPPIPDLAHEFSKRCDGFVFTGGDDPRTEPFGEPTHPKATPVEPERQAFETALLEELQRRPGAPVLGVCLGMQMMALHAGGKLNQHMPDDVPTAEQHRHDAVHLIHLAAGGTHAVVTPGEVTSHHRQAVRDAGRMRVVAVAPDGIIEAIDDPARAFYLGVQWHPERTAFKPLGITLFKRLVQAARP